MVNYDSINGDSRMGRAGWFLLLIAGCSCLWGGCGCPYGFTINTLPKHIKTVAIPTFHNQTDRYGMEEALGQLLTQKFQAAGLRVLTSLDQVDATLEGEITSYTKSRESYDEAGLIQEYRITISCSWKFTDQVEKRVLSSATNTRGYKVYAIDDATGDTIDKEEAARDAALEMLADEMAAKILENW